MVLCNLTVANSEVAPFSDGRRAVAPGSHLLAGLTSGRNCEHNKGPVPIRWSRALLALNGAGNCDPREGVPMLEVRNRLAGSGFLADGV